MHLRLLAPVYRTHGPSASPTIFHPPNSRATCPTSLLSAQRKCGSGNRPSGHRRLAPAFESGTGVARQIHIHLRQGSLPSLQAVCIEAHPIDSVTLRHLTSRTCRCRSHHQKCVRHGDSAGRRREDVGRRSCAYDASQPASWQAIGISREPICRIASSRRRTIFPRYHLPTPVQRVIISCSCCRRTR